MQLITSGRCYYDSNAVDSEVRTLTSLSVYIYIIIIIDL